MPITVKALAASRLYSVTRIEDVEAGILNCYFPITMEGDDDESREMIFIGETNIQFPNTPPITIRFPIKAKSIAIALQQWHETCSNAIAQWESQQRQHLIASAAAAGMPKPKIQLPS